LASIDSAKATIDTVSSRHRPALSALAERYALAGNVLERILADGGQRAFGHLSGGLGRQGEDFLTVYYEIEGL